MATTTTNYGWDIPQSTDLVKDGATAIATLGQDIDTSIYTALGGNKSGLVLLNTTSFSGVASFSLPASTFTSTYDNYRIIINIDSSVGGVQMDIRMRAAGTDNTSANYTFARAGATQANAFAGASNEGSLATSWNQVVSGTYSSSIVLDVMQPANTGYNTNFSAANFYFDSLTNYRAGFTAGALSVTTAYDSMTFFPSSGTVTGVYSVYGYNK